MCKSLLSSMSSVGSEKNRWLTTPILSSLGPEKNQWFSKFEAIVEMCKDL